MHLPVSQICKVTSLSSTITSFVRKSAPMVALYWLLNFLFTYWYIREVLPTLPKEGERLRIGGYVKKAEAYPLSPKMMIFNKTFLRVDILSCLVVLQLNKYDSLKVLALLYFPSFPQLLLRMTRSRLAFGQKHTLYGVGATRRSGSRQLLLHLATPLNEWKSNRILIDYLLY